MTELLTLRLSPLALTLPPVVTAAPGGLRLSAETRVAIRDGATTTTGRMWGALDFRFAAHGVEPITVVTPGVRAAASNATLHLELDGELAGAHYPPGQSAIPAHKQY